MLLCECSHSEALTKVLFGDDLVEVAKAETVYQEKTKDTMKIFLVKAQGLLIVHKVGSKFSADLSYLLFEKLKTFQVERIVVLDSIYKTNYSLTDHSGYVTQIDGPIPLKYYKNSFVEKD